MLTTLPFKIIVDSRNAVTGTANNFSISLPETLHIDRDVAMYVNSASVTNTFYRLAPTSDRRIITSIGLSDWQTLTLFLIVQLCQREATLPKNLHLRCRLQSIVRHGLEITSTLAFTILTHRQSQCPDQTMVFVRFSYLRIH